MFRPQPKRIGGKDGLIDTTPFSYGKRAGFFAAFPSVSGYHIGVFS
jgi:hypothetical protein